MADAHGSGPCVREDVGVQLPPRPPDVIRITAGQRLARPSVDREFGLLVTGLVTENSGLSSGRPSIVDIFGSVGCPATYCRIRAATRSAASVCMAGETWL